MHEVTFFLFLRPLTNTKVIKMPDTSDLVIWLSFEIPRPCFTLLLCYYTFPNCYVGPLSKLTVIGPQPDLSFRIGA